MAQPTARRVVADPRHKEATKTFLGLLADVTNREGWREREAFRTWLHAAFYSLRGSVLKPDGDAWRHNEAEYMKIVARCQIAKATMGDFARLLGIAGRALAEAPYDFLGPIFMEVEANTQIGQFFTPDSVSELIARLSLSNVPVILAEARAEGRDHLLLQEPACGVGGMILASNRVLTEQGLDIGRDAYWHAIDVDFDAMCGCYIQLALTGSSAVVYHGNTLTLETWLATPTPAALMRAKKPAALPEAAE
ncbi:N-6 DNA Methylase [Faunimonas pinastri]|uniref:N-6 DNA Methylase n=1 Tax=Faunimonas pinastri TaxID=1855383 RepID=A0A1H9MW08_9HYPH|nr:N-6 DNA methylase [Faunimonas pinastri]SER27659.1 N-6 DNA Methylase [Faunimonas pinastri]